MKRILLATVRIECEDKPQTEEDLKMGMGLAPDDEWPEDMDRPTGESEISTYSPHAVAECLQTLEYSEEAFAGSGLYVSINKVNVQSAQWEDQVCRKTRLQSLLSFFSKRKAVSR